MRGEVFVRGVGAAFMSASLAGRGGAAVETGGNGLTSTEAKVRKGERQDKRKLRFFRNLSGGVFLFLGEESDSCRCLNLFGKSSSLSPRSGLSFLRSGKNAHSRNAQGRPRHRSRPCGRSPARRRPPCQQCSMEAGRGLSENASSVQRSSTYAEFIFHLT